MVCSYSKCFFTDFQILNDYIAKLVEAGIIGEGTHLQILLQGISPFDAKVRNTLFERLNI